MSTYRLSGNELSQDKHPKSYSRERVYFPLSVLRPGDTVFYYEVNNDCRAFDFPRPGETFWYTPAFQGDRLPEGPWEIVDVQNVATHETRRAGLPYSANAVLYRALAPAPADATPV